MRLDYSRLHWGIDARRTRDLIWPSECGGRVGAEIVALSYHTTKEELEGTTFEHVFERHSWGRARIIWLDDAESAHDIQTVAAPASLLILGRIVDVKLAGGRRVTFGDAFACTGKTSPFTNGNPLIIASAEGRPAFAIEHHVSKRRIWPYVTEHGIEG